MSDKRKWNWREHLTDDERIRLRLMDGAKLKWQELSSDRPRIVNRAIQRAKYAASKDAEALKDTPHD